MKGLCGLYIDKDRTYISFAQLKKYEPMFLQETDLEIAFESGNLVKFLQDNSGSINQKISEREKALSLNVEKIYISLPWEAGKDGVFSVTVPLEKRKKITAKDILTAKKYLQNTYLDWDDFCVHNFVMEYEVDGVVYKTPPLGVTAKKIKVTSFLVWIKDKLRKDVEDIFYNMERGFAGFVFSAASAASTVFPNRSAIDDSSVIIDIGYDRSFVILLKDKKIISIKESSFCLKNILEELGKKILLPPVLLQEVFDRYVSFKELSHLKEVSIKNAENYINISTQAANSFIREYMKNEISSIIENIKSNFNEKFTVYFTGRFNNKDGFYDFVKGFIPCAVKAPCVEGSCSVSFGCVRYGALKFLENDSRKDSFFGRIMDVYKEYF